MTTTNLIDRIAIEKGKQGTQSIPARDDWRNFRDILGCPLCKGDLTESQATFLCPNCSSKWPMVGRIPDFRQHSGTEPFKRWQQFQNEFEREAYEPKYAFRDREGCREVYEQLPAAIQGAFLDIGGADGTVRYFLPRDVAYLCVDPFLEAPRLALARGQDAKFREVFPCFTEPYAFVCAMAERLPIRSGQFDWVHMRSMIDHVADPPAVLKEAFRCLKPGGYLLMGVSARGGKAKTVEPGLVGLLAQAYRVLHYEGPKEFAHRLIRRLRGHRDHHLWHPSVHDLRTLLTGSGLLILHETWTSPPFDHVVYLLATRPIEEECPPV
jgi:SAM-dependent methyltransferase